MTRSAFMVQRSIKKPSIKRQRPIADENHREVLARPAQAACVLATAGRFGDKGGVKELTNAYIHTAVVTYMQIVYCANKAERWGGKFVCPRKVLSLVCPRKVLSLSAPRQENMSCPGYTA